MDINFTASNEAPGWQDSAAYKQSEIQGNRHKLSVGLNSRGYTSERDWRIIHLNHQEGERNEKKSREFTPEEQSVLEKNPYTYRVYKSSIRFTRGFKEEFMRQYEAGVPPTKIVEGLGYDADMLGSRCINSLYRNFQKQQASPAGLHEGGLTASKNPTGFNGLLNRDGEPCCAADAA